jgi:predicted transcriptional regulator
MLEGFAQLKSKALNEKLTFEDVMKHVLGLTDNEVKVYKTLRSRWMTASELCEVLGVKRPALQYMINKLYNLGLLMREVRIPPRGGFMYAYRAVEIEKVRKMLRDLLTAIYYRALEALKESPR